MAKIGGIYRILNKIDGKFYIGNTNYFSQRFASHKHDLIYNKHPNSYLQNAWNKYGADNFIFEQLEVIIDLTILIEREQYWMDLTKCYNREIGYNLRIVANGNNGITTRLKGSHPTQETKDKIRKGNLHKVVSDETRAKISAWQIGIIPVKATEAAAIVNRNYERWPCEDGCKCRCTECKKKRAEVVRNFIKRKKIRECL